MKHHRQLLARLCLALSIVCSISTTLTAQVTIGRQKVDQFPSSPWGHTLYGLTWLPTDYNSNPTQKYPLIIFLHGVGESGYGPWGLYSLLGNGVPLKIAGGWNAEAVNPNTGQTEKFIVISPQANVWSPEWSVMQYMLPDIMDRYRVDASRIYVTGLSAGGQATWSYVTSGPAAKKFAAIVPVSSANAVALDSIPNVRSKYGVKVWQVCGDQDTFWGFVTNSTNLYNNTSSSTTPAAVLTPLPGIGHWGWNEVYDPSWHNNQLNLNIYEWMLKQKRDDTGNGNNTPNVTANAGPDQTITLPLNSVQLSASGYASNGANLKFNWSKVSGPGNASFNNKKIANPIVSDLVAGTHVFRVKVKSTGPGNNDNDDDDDDNNSSNGNGTSDTDEITIVVNPPVPVVAYASIPGKLEAENYAAQNGVLKENTSDAGGGQNLQWIENSDWMDYKVNATGTGNYTLRLRVATPFNGGNAQIRSANGSVLATVNLPNTNGYQAWQTVNTNLSLPPGQQIIRIVSTGYTAWNMNWLEFLTANQPPTVQAGSNQTITLPLNSITLNGNAADSDGTITSFVWSKVSGGSANFTAENAATTTVNNLSLGTYIFRLTVTDNNGSANSSDVQVTVNPAPVVISYLPIPGKIQAEQFSLMDGVMVETTYDANGGQNLHWIENGDWMEYRVNPATAGNYSLNLRIAAPASGSQLQIKKQDGTILQTVNLPNTSGYQNWLTVNAIISLPAGQQTIRVVSTAPALWNFNWMEFVPAPASTPTPTPTSSRIEAENYTNMSGVLKETTYDLGGGQNVHWIENSDWMEYSVSVPASGIYNLNMRIATPASGAQFQIRKADGTVLQTTSLPYTGGYQSWQTISAAVPLVSGTQTIRFVSNSETMWNFNWLEVLKAIRIEAEQYTSMFGVYKETTYDVDGIQDLHWIENNDWMQYNIQVPSAGNYLMNFRVAAPASGAQLQIRKANGTILQTVSIPNTNGYQSWITVNATVPLEGGVQPIRIVSTAAPLWNFNWMEVVGGGAAGGSSLKIEAEDYSSMSGVLKETTYDTDGGVQDLHWIDQNDWMEYGVDIPSSGNYTVNFRIATPLNGANFQVRKEDGTLLQTVYVPNTGGYQSWQTISTQVSLDEGFQNIRLVSTSIPIWNINWLEFVSTEQNSSSAARGVVITENEEPVVATTLEFYPNPVQDRLVLRLNNALTGPVKVEIVDVRGVVVKTCQVSKSSGLYVAELPVSSLQKGNYIVRIRMNGYSESKKITKK